jgi:hypothetical protein
LSLTVGRTEDAECISAGKAAYVSEFARIDPEFDRFIYAPIGERNEIPLSVLSFLTRQNIDPWQLASHLSQLPKGEAAKTLTSIVEESDDRQWSRSEATEAAARLIELLPGQKISVVTTLSIESVQGHLTIWLIYGIFWGMLALSAGNSQQAGKDHSDPAMASAVISQQIPSPFPKSRTD